MRKDGILKLDEPSVLANDIMAFIKRNGRRKIGADAHDTFNAWAASRTGGVPPEHAPFCLDTAGYLLEIDDDEFEVLYEIEKKYGGLPEWA
jgi:hypothetical protein